MSKFGPPRNQADNTLLERFQQELTKNVLFIEFEVLCQIYFEFRNVKDRNGSLAPELCHINYDDLGIWQGIYFHCFALYDGHCFKKVAHLQVTQLYC